jgi:hypothetical protein
MLKLKILLTMLIGMGVSFNSFGQQDSNFVKRTPVSGSLSTSCGKVAYWDSEKQKNVFDINYAVALNTGISLGNHYNFSFTLNLPINEKVSKKLPYASDYSLALYRNKYTSNSFFWGYSNYNNNKYSNSLNQIEHSLATGNFSFGYIIKVPDSLMKYLKIFPSSKLSSSFQLNYAIKYYDINGKYSGGIIDGKSSINFNLKYIVFNNFFISGAVNYYFSQATKLPWDSDYAYAFGFENWKPWKLSFSYAKYTNTFPWNGQPVNSGFLYGAFTISFNYSINYKKHI